MAELDTGQQAALGAATLGLCLVFDRSQNAAAPAFLRVLAVATTLRYLAWRITDTLDFATVPEAMLGTGVLAAELYAAAALAVAAGSALRPPGGLPVALTGDPAEWPGVDVFIPAGPAAGGAADIQAAVLGALAIDWPPEQLRVHLLDDGRLAGLAAACGAGSLPTGLDEALRQTDGALVAVFAAGHVATRAFLQLTAGGFAADPHLAATHAGAAATVFRRAALTSTGGLAGGGATTLLRLQRRGWRCTTLAIPVAGKLGPPIWPGVPAWLRDIKLLFTTGAPLGGHGLTLRQRGVALCAVLPGLSAAVWVTLLAAPLAPLLLGQTIIAAAPLALAAYALPHVALAARCTRRVWGAMPAGAAGALTALLAIGIAVGLARLADGGDPAAALNTVWAACSLATILGYQRRRAQLRAALPVSLVLADGRRLAGVTRHVSRRGVLVQGDGPGVGPARACFSFAGESVEIPCRLAPAGGTLCHVRFQPRCMADEAAIVRLVYGRADAWMAAGSDRVAQQSRIRPATRADRVRLAARAAGAALAMLPATGLADRPPVRVHPAPIHTWSLAPPPPALDALLSATTADSAPAGREITLTLRQLGMTGAVALNGTTPWATVPFAVRADEAVVRAVLYLSGDNSPALSAALGSVTVTLNDQYVASLGAAAQHFDGPDIPLNPASFQRGNLLGFRFTGRAATGCHDPLDAAVWTTLSDRSSITLTLERLPAVRDLGRLPLPFLDAGDPQALRVAFVLQPGSASETLQAAAIAASWLGSQAASRDVGFAAVTQAPQTGNAVVFVNGQDGPAALAGLPPIAGPTLAVLPNPADPDASLLLIAGRTGGEIVAAARALALGSRTLQGEVAHVTAPELPPRVPYDAPAWVATDGPVRLGDLTGAPRLQGAGFVPGVIRVPFQTAPDLFSWRNRPFPLTLRFHAPPGPIADLAVSRLDVGVNGQFLSSLPFAAAGAESRVALPATALAGRNELQLAFDARPLRRGECSAIPQDLRMAVDPDSTVDFSQAYHFIEMPNLAAFASAGFPFTRMADLSETAVILPDRLTAAELQAFLDLMGRMGAMTGVPAVKVAVARPGAGDLGDRDLLMIGVIPRLGAALTLLGGSPYRADGARLRVELGGPITRLVAGGERDRAVATLAAGVEDGTAALVGAANPAHAGRSVVAVLGGSPDAVGTVVAALTTQASSFAGDLALVHGGGVTSFRAGSSFTAGNLPGWLYLPWLLRGSPAAVIASLAAGCGLVAALRHVKRP